MTLSPLVSIGEISYSGVYLWHGLFFGSQVGALGLIRKFIIDLILSFLLASISYFLVEKPLLQIKDKHFHQ